MAEGGNRRPSEKRPDVARFSSIDKGPAKTQKGTHSLTEFKFFFFGCLSMEKVRITFSYQEGREAFMLTVPNTANVLRFLYKEIQEVQAHLTSEPYGCSFKTRMRLDWGQEYYNPQHDDPRYHTIAFGLADSHQAGFLRKQLESHLGSVVKSVGAGDLRVWQELRERKSSTTMMLPGPLPRSRSQPSVPEIGSSGTAKPKTDTRRSSERVTSKHFPPLPRSSPSSAPVPMQVTIDDDATPTPPPPPSRRRPAAPIPILTDDQQAQQMLKWTNGHDTLTLTRGDMLRLQPSEFLNDSIINFYLRYLEKERFSAALRERVFIFNTFFIERLRRVSDKNSTNLYEAVKKWTKGVDILRKDFIVVPINESAHWTLAIICYPSMSAEEAAAATVELPRTTNCPVCPDMSFATITSCQEHWIATHYVDPPPLTPAAAAAAAAAPAPLAAAAAAVAAANVATLADAASPPTLATVPAAARSARTGTESGREPAEILARDSMSSESSMHRDDPPLRGVSPPGSPGIGTHDDRPDDQSDDVFVKRARIDDEDPLLQQAMDVLNSPDVLAHSGPADPGPPPKDPRSSSPASDSSGVKPMPPAAAKSPRTLPAFLTSPPRVPTAHFPTGPTAPHSLSPPLFVSPAAAAFAAPISAPTSAAKPTKTKTPVKPTKQPEVIDLESDEPFAPAAVDKAVDTPAARHGSTYDCINSFTWSTQTYTSARRATRAAAREATDRTAVQYAYGGLADDFDELPAYAGSAPARTTAVSKLQTTYARRRPCILMLDSLGGRKTSNCNLLRNYLNSVLLVQRSDHTPLDTKTLPQLNVIAPNQDNYSDCGVFLLRYVEQFFGVNMKGDPPPARSVVGLDSYAGKSPSLRTFPLSEIADMREELKLLVTELASASEAAQNEAAVAAVAAAASLAAAAAAEGAGSEPAAADVSPSDSA